MSIAAPFPNTSLLSYINVKLTLLGCEPVAADGGAFDDIVATLIAQHREKERLLANHLCPADSLVLARKVLVAIDSPGYLEKLTGTIGAEPIHPQHADA